MNIPACIISEPEAEYHARSKSAPGISKTNRRAKK